MYVKIIKLNTSNQDFIDSNSRCRHSTRFTFILLMVPWNLAFFSINLQKINDIAMMNELNIWKKDENMLGEKLNFLCLQKYFNFSWSEETDNCSYWNWNIWNKNIMEFYWWPNKKTNQCVGVGVKLVRFMDNNYCDYCFYIFGSIKFSLFLAQYIYYYHSERS